MEIDENSFFSHLGKRSRSQSPERDSKRPMMISTQSCSGISPLSLLPTSVSLDSPSLTRASSTDSFVQRASRMGLHSAITTPSDFTNPILYPIDTSEASLHPPPQPTSAEMLVEDSGADTVASLPEITPTRMYPHSAPSSPLLERQIEQFAPPSPRLSIQLTRPPFPRRPTPNGELYLSTTSLAPSFFTPSKSPISRGHLHRYPRTELPPLPGSALVPAEGWDKRPWMASSPVVECATPTTRCFRFGPQSSMSDGVVGMDL